MILSSLQPTGNSAFTWNGGWLAHWIGVNWFLPCHRQADNTTPEFHYVSDSIGGAARFGFETCGFSLLGEKQAGTAIWFRPLAFHHVQLLPAHAAAGDTRSALRRTAGLKTLNLRHPREKYKP